MTGPLDPVPMSASRAGCAAHVRRVVGQWIGCPGAPTHAGTYTYRYPRRSVEPAFACDEHAHLLASSHLMTDDDRVELERRRDRDTYPGT